MTRSEQDKANRLYYLKAGRCPNCGGSRPIVEGTKRCAECQEKDRKRKKEMRDKRLADGLCVKCGKPLGDDTHKTCEKCRSREVNYHHNDKVTYQRRKSTGMCVDCGKYAAEAGRVLCKKCMNKRKIDNRRNDPGWAKKNERRQRLVAAGLCIDCSRPTQDGKQRCRACIEARRDSTRKYRIKKKIYRQAEQARRANS